MQTNAAKPVLLIVDDDPIIADTLSYFLGSDFEIAATGSRSAAIEWLQAQTAPPPLALVDLGLPPEPHRPEEGFALISELLVRAPQLRIIVLSGQNGQDNARHALALGAIEFLTKPAPPEQLRSLLLRLLDLATDKPPTSALPLLGTSPAMQKLRAQLQQYADSPYPVLIEGESGSGKELAATALHTLSQRAKHPYLTINCAAIAPTLIEAALFGHAKGAFTGAGSARSGFFADAGTGTLLLDEIGELPLELQPKLLRVMENGEYQRVGETQARLSGARIIAATNRDLKQEVRAGRFRTDLYHRLSVFSLTVPPLRELGEDRLLLLDHFRQQISAQLRQPPFSLDTAARQLWLDYPFPGNVRELRNIVIRLSTRHAGQVVSPAALAEELDPLVVQKSGSVATSPSGLPPAQGNPELPVESAIRQLSGPPGQFSLDLALKRWENAYIEAARQLTNNNVSQMARLLGINRTTLYNRLDILARQQGKPGNDGRTN